MEKIKTPFWRPTTIVKISKDFGTSHLYNTFRFKSQILVPGIQFKSRPSLFSSWNISNYDEEKVSSNLKVVYLATYYSLTTQCEMQWLLNLNLMRQRGRGPLQCKTRPWTCGYNIGHLNLSVETYIPLKSHISHVTRPMSYIQILVMIRRHGDANDVV